MKVKSNGPGPLPDAKSSKLFFLQNQMAFDLGLVIWH